MRKNLVAVAVLCLCLVRTASAADNTDKLKELFPDGVVDAAGKSVPLDQLKDKILGIYFSAHWCPPCRAFSPKLVEFRDKNAKDFEVVFVSSDKTPKDQETYMTEVKMKWPTMKLNSTPATALKKKYNVTGIPKLVIVAPNGETITENGRGEVTSSPDKCLAEWQKKVK